MQFIQQFTTGDWEKPLHRLVVITDSGVRIVGSWAADEHESRAYHKDDVDAQGTPTSGWLGFTDYYEGAMPKVVRFTAVDTDEATLTTEEVPQSEFAPQLAPQLPPAVDFFILEEPGKPAVVHEQPFYPDEDDEDEEDDEVEDAPDPDEDEDEQAALDEEFAFREPQSAPDARPCSSN